jgi:hypothetical protein
MVRGAVCRCGRAEGRGPSPAHGTYRSSLMERGGTGGTGWRTRWCGPADRPGRPDGVPAARAGGSVGAGRAGRAVPGPCHVSGSALVVRTRRAARAPEGAAVAVRGVVLSRFRCSRRLLTCRHERLGARRSGVTGGRRSADRPRGPGAGAGPVTSDGGLVPARPRARRGGGNAGVPCGAVAVSVPGWTRAVETGAGGHGARAPAKTPEHEGCRMSDSLQLSASWPTRRLMESLPLVFMKLAPSDGKEQRVA